jgi:hypothetical protein
MRSSSNYAIDNMTPYVNTPDGIQEGRQPIAVPGGAQSQLYRADRCILGRCKMVGRRRKFSGHSLTPVCELAFVIRDFVAKLQNLLERHPMCSPGERPTAIAKRLKRSEQAVRHRFYKLGISLKMVDKRP